MKIGFIGGGYVAQNVGTAFVQAGHEVMISSRNPASAHLLKWQGQTGPKARLGSFEEAARFGEVIFLAIKWDGLVDTIKSLDPALFTHKVIIDPTNATRLNTDTNTGELLLTNDSVGEIVQRLLPDSHVVKAMNLTTEAHPVREEGTPMMPIAGNSADAKTTVTKLLNDLGWSFVADLGDIKQSRPIESPSVLMMDYVFSTQNFKALLTIIRK